MEQQQKTNEMVTEQQRQANETQNRLHEQMAKKDEELPQVQRQFLEVLGRRPQPIQHQHIGPQIVISNRERIRIFCLNISVREAQRSSPARRIL